MKSNKLTLGVFASADAGKTTLSENILFNSGVIRRIGHVDEGDSFLDSDSMEKERGISIFSKEARFSVDDMDVVLIDTPGHIDFAAEAERTLNILDAAILIISSDGINKRTGQIWSKLDRYRIPRLIFVNKCDLASFDRKRIEAQLQRISSATFDVINLQKIDDDLCEKIAFSSDLAFDIFEQNSGFSKSDIKMLINRAALFPCVYGSALKGDGVKELIKSLSYFDKQREYDDAFSCFVYKITRDKSGSRLSHVKITGGSISLKQSINDEKINDIRLYNGDRFISKKDVSAGEICVLTGLEKTISGQLIDRDKIAVLPKNDASVVSRKIKLPSGANFHSAAMELKKIYEELPEIQLEIESNNDIRIAVTGELQLQTLSRIIERRLGYCVEFGEESITYLETIAKQVEGYGHFEPLKHYAEVHVRLVPLPQGTGIKISSSCSETEFPPGKQNKVLNILQEYDHRGVLTGSRLTDVEIVLLHAKEHARHTEGGDFWEAARRAVRQALMKASSVLLEPVYSFEISVLSDDFGKINSELTKLGAVIDSHSIDGDVIILKGSAPVINLKPHIEEISAFSIDGSGFDISSNGYLPCRNSDAVISASKYNPDEDTENPSSSIFTQNGSGTSVSWRECEEFMHIKPYVKRVSSNFDRKSNYSRQSLDDIFKQTYGKNNVSHVKYKKLITPEQDEHKYQSKHFKNSKKTKHVLLVDAYNLIHANTYLKDLAKLDLGAAREKMLEIVAEYSSMKGFEAILVFDAYKNKDRLANKEDALGVSFVFTASNETADSYIERYVFEHIKSENITVVTSDRLEQMTIFQMGANRQSASDFFGEFDLLKTKLMSHLLH